MSDNTPDFAPALAALAVQTPVTVTTSSSVTVTSSPAALTDGQGSSIASASSISVDHKFHVVTGGTTVNTILVSGATPANGTIVILEAVGALTLGTAGNIFPTGVPAARTVPSQAAVTLVYSGTTSAWVVAGVGS